MKRAPLAEFDRAVRNTYKVLLTRGMLGTVLYSTDAETQRFLSALLPVEVAAAAGRSAPPSRV